MSCHLRLDNALPTAEHNQEISQQKADEPLSSGGPSIRFTNRCLHLVIVQRHPDPRGLEPWVDRMLKEVRDRGNSFEYSNNEGLAVLTPGQSYVFNTEDCDQYITVYWQPGPGQPIVNACTAFRVPINRGAVIDGNPSVHME